jgi:hypothetical protein
LIISNSEIGEDCYWTGGANKTVEDGTIWLGVRLRGAFDQLEIGARMEKEMEFYLSACWDER